jgi:hypothetical protein
MIAPSTAADAELHASPGGLQRRRAFPLLKLLGYLVRNGEARETARGISNDLDDLISLVDGFYRLLGPRNWVFSNALNLERMRKVVAMPTPEEAERELAAYLGEDGTLLQMVSWLNRFPDMRPRLPLLKKAVRDYLEGRYYSSVLVTVSTMDGFVNDAFRSEERRGLHARRPEELHVDDCVATVWDGLPSAQEAFTKSFYARVDTPVYEVYRNGIMHGMITDYDNVIVASKAWCMLFAIGDWVDAKTIKQENSKKEPRTPTQVLKGLSEARNRKADTDKKLAAWKKHRVKLESPIGPDIELIKDCNAFFAAWQSKNYGSLGSYLTNSDSRTPGKQAGEAKNCYHLHPIERFEVEEIDRQAPETSGNRCRHRSNWLTRTHGHLI